MAVPGMPNGHSHAFQRALVGLGEKAQGAADFWSWRALMYRVAGQMEPEALESLAVLAYTEMLAAGFTAVAEFFYLHHEVDGTPGTAMAEAVIRAARTSGIRQRLVLAYYERGGIDRPLEPVQRMRFAHPSPAAFADYAQSLADHPLAIAAHSIRAVSPDSLVRCGLLAAELAEGLFHIHVAEQESEVVQSRSAYGVGPIAHLSRLGLVGPGLQAVHATHADAAERALLVEQGANVVLCPITEAYLGDGLFPAGEHLARKGSWAVGSDANVRLDALEELRLLEYGQRLCHRQRGNLADRSGLATRLWQEAAQGGARAVAFPVGRIEPGALADFVVLEDVSLFGGGDPELGLDAFLLGGSRESIRRVYVGGELRWPIDPVRYETIRREAGGWITRMREAVTRG
jgi:formimidoylglutamate deiminase